MWYDDILFTCMHYKVQGNIIIDGGNCIRIVVDGIHRYMFPSLEEKECQSIELRHTGSMEKLYL